MNQVAPTANTAFSAGEVVSFGRATKRVIVADHAETAWWTVVRGRLDELVKLPSGWNGYDAQPVSFVNAHFAALMLAAICSDETPAPQIVPGSCGDLQVEWHSATGDIELHVRAPNDVIAWHRDEQTGPDGEEVVLTNNFIAVGNWIVALERVGAAAAAA